MLPISKVWICVIITFVLVMYFGFWNSFSSFEVKKKSKALSEEVIPVYSMRPADVSIEKPQQIFSNIEQRLEKTGSETCPRWQLNGSNKVYLQKTQFNNEFRFIYVLGLEGSGHHMWESAAIKEPSFYRLRPYFKRNLVNISVWHRCKFMSRTRHTNIFRRLAGTLKSLNVNGTMMEFISYPTYAGRCKPFCYNDMRLLAETSEEAGMDFRIVVILRDKFDMMKSVFRRGFFNQYWKHGYDPLESYIEVMKTLISQIEFLDSRFIQCSHYENPVANKSLDTFVRTDSSPWPLKTTFERTHKESKTTNVSWAELDNYLATHKQLEIFESLYVRLNRLCNQ